MADWIELHPDWVHVLARNGRLYLVSTFNPHLPSYSNISISADILLNLTLARSVFNLTRCIHLEDISRKEVHEEQREGHDEAEVLNPETVASIKRTTTPRREMKSVEIVESYYVHVEYQQVRRMPPGEARERIYAHVEQQDNILQDYDGRVLSRI